MEEFEQMRNQTRLLSLVFLLSLVIAGAGCSSSGEEPVKEAYASYQNALHSGNIDQLKNLLAEEKSQALNSPNAREMLEMVGALFPTAPSIEKVTIEGSDASIELQASMDGMDMTGTVSMVKEGGKWKVLEEKWDATIGVTLTGTGNWAGYLLENPLKNPAAALRWKAHEGEVTEVAFTPDGQLLVSVGYNDSALRLWDRESGRMIDEIKMEHGPRDLTLVPRSSDVAVVDSHGTVKLWSVDFMGFGEPRPLNGRAGTMAQIAASADGKLLATTSFDGPVKIWSIAEGRPTQELSKSSRMRGIDFSPKGNTLAAGSHGNSFTIWKKVTGEESKGRKKVKVPKASKNSDVWTVAFSRDGKKLVTGHMDSSVSVWAVKKRKELHNLYVPDASTYDVSFSPDGTLFASAQQNGKVYLWDAETGTPLRRIPAHKGAATTLAFSPTEGEVLVSGGEDGNLILWH